MTDQPQETLPEVVKIKDVLTLAQDNVPLMSAGSARAVAKMQTYTTCESQEKYEEIEAVLVKVREAYTKINKMRTDITGTLDNFKSYLMTFEKPLGDADKNSEYNRVRAILVKFKQDELEAKKKIEAEAAKKKQRSDHFVDIEATIKKNLVEMVARVANKVETDSAAYFGACTLETFDKKAELYLKGKPNLKQVEYDSCFNVSIRKDLYSETEIADIMKSFKEAEPMATWSERMIELATPIVNAWRAKIPDLRANLVALKNAGADRERLEAEQKKKAEEEAARRKTELEAQQAAAQANIAAKAQLGKLENSFIEQATVQQAGETGPTKLVLKFKEYKDIPKALATIIYMCLAHPKFGGTIQKHDKKGNPVVDAQGRPEYIDEVQRWINFFLANCDAEVEGTMVYEDSKISIRK